MFRYLLTTACLLFIATPSFAQLHDNDYRNSGNPMYWQNRKPDAAYWQQDVQYDINAKMVTTENRIDGAESLTYWNNSPDTLTYVYFHLYQNAFIKGSYLHDLELANKVKPKMGKNETKGLGIVIDHLTADNTEVKTELDNTILKIFLPHPVYPGGRIIFNMTFETYYDNGATRRRMQMWDAWGYTHYNGCQWFPKICVYDRKFGWDTHQHLNREFYGDFGSYDVKLDFPSNYILEATGMLQNKAEALPDTLLAKLDIKNFAGKKWNEKPSVIIPFEEGKRKVWHYQAINVHDFAFTADPSYRIAIRYWNGIQCEAIVQEPHASGWQNAADYVTKIIRTFSEDIGMYQYPKMVAADAQDGMEYPMLTLDGGSEPGYRGLFVHEIAHNWFYGMVGSNETYRAALDEGFTQFLTAWGLRRIDGDTLVAEKSKSKYRRHFATPTNVLDLRVLGAYSSDALNQKETQLNTHSDDFGGALGQGGDYREVYYKTASMLYNLEYTLGDSLFKHAFQHYFSQWRFAHPYFEEFRNSIIQYTHVDLNWFFDEWLETTKGLDYSIGRINRLSGNDSFAIRFRRIGEMQMPLDFTITSYDGVKYNFYIPNTWFRKNTSAFTLPEWYGWGKPLEPTYTAHVQIPGGIRKVQIDTTYRLADLNMTNNYKDRGPIRFSAISGQLDGGLKDVSNRRKYKLYIRPDLWWNPVDGVKAGVHFEGDYLFTLDKIDATVWYNTHLLEESKYQPAPGKGIYSRYAPVNYSFNYLSPVIVQMPRLQVQINSRFLDGLWYHRAGFNWLTNTKNSVQLYGQTLWRPTSSDFNYLIDPRDWSSNSSHLNSTLNASWAHVYNYLNGNGIYIISLRTPFLQGNSTNSYNYSYARIEAINHNKLDKLDISTRFFASYGTGSKVPYESALYLAGASPEEEMENKYTRSIGFEPADWQGISRYDVNHFQQGGGLGLRGYAGYFVPDQRNGATLEAYKGTKGASVNIEAGFDNYLPLKPKLTKNWLHVDLYGFTDAGFINLSNFTLPNYYAFRPTNHWDDFHMDAGIGTAFTIKKFGVFEKAKPLTIRFDMPLFLNRAPYNNPEYVTFRYVVGINRAF